MSPDCPLEVPSSEKAKDTVTKAFFAISASPCAFQGEREVTLYFFFSHQVIGKNNSEINVAYQICY